MGSLGEILIFWQKLNLSNKLNFGHCLSETKMWHYVMCSYVTSWVIMTLWLCNCLQTAVILRIICWIMCVVLNIDLYSSKTFPVLIMTSSHSVNDKFWHHHIWGIKWKCDYFPAVVFSIHWANKVIIVTKYLFLVTNIIERSMFDKLLRECHTCD